ncbi:MAG: sugar ABC transporter permease [Anaerolineales bacterium]|nr:sugar ABC transporter permease [Anaerolineales bacterium]
MPELISHTTTSKQKEAHPHAALRRRENIIGLLFLSPWLLGFVLLKLLPILFTFGYSFTDFKMISPDKATFVGLQNYIRFATDLDAWSSLVGSLGYFMTTVPLEVLVALALATILSSQRMRLKALWRLVIFIPSIIPAAAIAFIWAGFINPDSGWLNRLFLIPMGLPPPVEGVGGIPALTTIMALWSIGPNFLIMYGAMLHVPKDLYEAARVDGAGPLMRFLNITIPMISPAIFFSVVISLTSAFGGSLLLDRGYVFSQSLSPMDGYIDQTMFSYFYVGYASALAWVMFSVTMTITIILFRSARRWVYFPEESRHESF